MVVFKGFIDAGGEKERSKGGVGNKVRATSSSHRQVDPGERGMVTRVEEYYKVRNIGAPGRGVKQRESEGKRARYYLIECQLELKKNIENPYTINVEKEAPSNEASYKFHRLSKSWKRNLKGSLGR